MRRFINYISIKRLKSDIAAMNGVMPLRRFIAAVGISGALVFGACMLYRIQWCVALAVMAVCVLMIPALVRNYFHERSEMMQFADVDIYLHQMTYSFMRNPKIIIALKDVQTISTGKLRECIDRAIDELDYGMSGNVYEDALGIIEDEYNCARIKALHRFMVTVEEKGGKYKGSLEVLLEDFDRWIGGTYRYQNELKKIKRDISIGIVISMVLAALTTVMCSMLNMFSDKSVSITNTLAYQAAAVIFVLLCAGFYVFTRKYYGMAWIDRGRSDKQIMRDYESAFKSRCMEMTVKLIPFWLSLTASGMYFVFRGKLFVALGIISCMIVMAAYPFADRKGAKRRVKADLYGGFTEWLRDLAVNLENKPLLAAIEGTYDTCPVIMKDSLGKFISQIEDNPSDVVPYYTFLGEFGSVDIQSAVRILYSIGELDTENMNQTIDALVRRNNAISEKAEQARYLDRTSMMRFSEYLPTFFVAFKMSVDMMLVVTMYL